MMFRRIIFDIIFFAGLFILPWYGVLVLAVFGIIVFKNYGEAVFIGIIMDLLYSVSSPGIISGRFGIWFVSLLIMVLIKEKLKKIIFVG